MEIPRVSDVSTQTLAAQSVANPALERVDGRLATVALGLAQSDTLFTADALTLRGASTVEDISSLSRLLLLSETGAARATNPALQPATSADFGGLLARSQLFVDSFNSLQNSQAGGIAGSTSPFLVALDAQINGAPTSAAGATRPLLSQLDDIGIGYSEPVPGAPAQLEIDVPTLQSAFEANPAATNALVTEAVQGLAQIVANLDGASGLLPLDAGNLTTPVAVLPAVATSPSPAGDTATTAGVGATVQAAVTLADLALQETLAATADQVLIEALATPALPQTAPSTAPATAATTADLVPPIATAPSATATGATVAPGAVTEAVAAQATLPPITQTALEQTLTLALGPNAGATAAAFLRPDAVLPYVRPVTPPPLEVAEISAIAGIQPIAPNLSNGNEAGLRRENAHEQRSEYLRTLNAGRISEGLVVDVLA